MSEKEARFLVDAYYIIQEDRKRFKNQTTAMGGEPHAVLAWFFQQNQTLEKQLRAALDRYSASKPIGQWVRGVFGIGPVIAAGLIAHIDIKQCPTAGPRPDQQVGPGREEAVECRAEDAVLAHRAIVHEIA